MLWQIKSLNSKYICFPDNTVEHLSSLFDFSVFFLKVLSHCAFSSSHSTVLQSGAFTIFFISASFFFPRNKIVPVYQLLPAGRKTPF